MAARKTVQSVEPNIADLVNGWLKSYQLDYKLEQESLNAEIDKALNDGYTRSNRKKASVNLRDTDHAKERYQEVVDLVRYGKGKLRLLTDKEYYEGHIDPESGEDWNQTAPIDTKPTLEDFKKTVSDYLAWEVSTLLKNQNQEDDCLKK